MGLLRDYEPSDGPSFQALEQKVTSHHSGDTTLLISCHKEKPAHIFSLETED